MAVRGSSGADAWRPPEFRPAQEDDLPACARVWRTSLAGYLRPLGLDHGLPLDLAPIRGLFEHLLRTDPDRFWVVTRRDADPENAHGPEGAGGERIIGFASANVRGRAWFLAMLFVAPGEQGHGVGGELLRRTMVGTEGLLLGTATDSAQPVSNALYARSGIVPRVPLLHLTGALEHPTALTRLADGVSAEPIGGLLVGDARRTIGAIDRELLGYEHPEDHAYLAADGRTGFLYRDASGRPIGYGYAARIGRVGPVAALDGGSLPAIVGDLMGRVPATGAHSLRVPGDAAGLVTKLLRAGFHLEPFPILVAFSEPYVDLSRYVPISAALL